MNLCIDVLTYTGGREALVKVQPVPLAAKKVEERPLLVDMMKGAKEDTSMKC